MTFAYVLPHWFHVRENSMHNRIARQNKLIHSLHLSILWSSYNSTASFTVRSSSKKVEKSNRYPSIQEQVTVLHTRITRCPMFITSGLNQSLLITCLNYFRNTHLTNYSHENLGIRGFGVAACICSNRLCRGTRNSFIVESHKYPLIKVTDYINFVMFYRNATGTSTKTRTHSMQTTRHSKPLHRKELLGNWGGRRQFLMTLFLANDLHTHACTKNN